MLKSFLCFLIFCGTNSFRTTAPWLHAILDVETPALWAFPLGGCSFLFGFAAWGPSSATIVACLSWLLAIRTHFYRRMDALIQIVL